MANNIQQGECLGTDCDELNLYLDIENADFTEIAPDKMQRCYKMAGCLIDTLPKELPAGSQPVHTSVVIR